MDYKGPNDLLIHVCELLLTVALISLTALMVPALAALFTLSNIEVAADLVVPMVVRPPDLFFLFGQLMILLTLWMYFRYFLPFISETPWDHLLSFFLAVLLCLNNYFSMLAPMLPCRGLFVSLVLLVTWFKDMRFIRRYPQSIVIHGWYRNVRFTLITATLAGFVFSVLMHPTARRLASSIAGPWYDIGFQSGFYVAFTIITTRSFLRNYEFFQWEWKGADSIDALGAPAR